MQYVVFVCGVVENLGKEDLHLNNIIDVPFLLQVDLSENF
jgi:hypothetical protein